MLSSRNIHFAVLGLIIGAASGYVFAFYQVQKSLPATAASNGSSGTSAPQNHPEVTNEQMLALFKEALDKNPDEPELMSRYANFLFDLRRFEEAVEWYQKVLKIQPDNLNVRTDMATTLWNMGDKERAISEYETAYKIDPKHIPTLQNLAAAHIDGDGDLQRAEELIKQLEEIDPNYSGLLSLRVRLEDRQRRNSPTQ